MDTIKIEGIYTANVYLVHTDQGAVLIDCGAEYSDIMQAVRRYNTRLCAVLLTHGHFDHILSAAQLQKDGLKIYIHGLDSERLHSDKHEGAHAGYNLQECFADCLVEDKDVLTFGNKSFCVVHTPGHTEGSVCYVSDGEIFTGDTIFCNDHGRTDLYGGDQSKIELSIKKLMKFDHGLVVHPGHGLSSTIGNEYAYYQRYNMV